MPRSAWASAAASLTPSPTIATDAGPRPAAAGRRRPCRPGSTSATTLARCRPRRPRARAARRVVAGEQHRAQARAPRSSATASATGRLDGVGDDEHAARPRRPSRPRPAVRPSASAAGDRAPSAAAAAWPRLSEAAAGRPHHDGVAVDDARARRGRARLAKSVDAGQRPTPSRPPAAMRPAERVLGGVLDRAGQPQRVVGRTPSAVTTSTQRHPAGGDGAGLVQHDRVDAAGRLQHLGPRIRMPSWAPRPVPTISAVGVASPSAHGQAMISTATAAVNAAVGGRTAERASRPASRARARSRPGTKTAGHPVGQPLHGGLAGLGLLDQPGDLRERGVGADPGGARRPAGRRR